MATVGQPLTAPEAGWKRFDATLENGFGFFPKEAWGIAHTVDAYNGMAFASGLTNAGGTAANIGAYCMIYFKGTKFRLISCCDYRFSTNYPITIDGKKYTFSVGYPNTLSVYGSLVFEIEGLENKEHVVRIDQGTDGTYQRLVVDAIDIDSDGYLVSPIFNLTATAGDAKVTLNWDVVTGATGYNVKRSQTAGGPYTTISSNVSGTSCVDSSVTNGTTYYYVVTAITAYGESANSNEASATPTASGGNPGTGDKALLRITMIDSSEREYKLPMSEITGFITWFDRTIGTGTTVYVLNKMISSKEYLAFDKIISFEVIPVAE